MNEYINKKIVELETVRPTYTEEYEAKCDIYVEHGDDDGHHDLLHYSKNCNDQACNARAICEMQQQKLGPT